MKKRILLVPIAVLLVAGAVLGGITLAKYTTTLRDDSSSFTANSFYFRSNVLSDSAECPIYPVIGKTTEFLLVNAKDTASCTAQDIAYTVSYFVRVDDAWAKMTEAAVSATLTGGSYSTASFTLSPIVWDRDADGVAEVYDNILVEAVATAPYQKTLRAEFCFEYVPNTVTYTYDRDFGVITVAISTNDDAGEYLITWTPGLLPDNADPNGILTQATATDGRAQADLDANTFYRLHFFVPAAQRPIIDAQIKDLDDEQVLQVLMTHISCKLQ